MNYRILEYKKRRDILVEYSNIINTMKEAFLNDMPKRTEHGYAITNHYKVEPRFGGNDAYKKLSDA